MFNPFPSISTIWIRICIARMFSNPENWSWTPGPSNEAWNSIHNFTSLSLSLLQLKQCLTLLKAMFVWLDCLILSRRWGQKGDICSVWECDERLGSPGEERPGWPRIPDEKTQSVSGSSLNNNTWNQQSTQEHSRWGNFYILFIKLLLTLCLNF